MFRATIYCQIAKWKLNRGVKLLERDGRLRSFKFVKKRNIETADGDVVMGAGKYCGRAAEALSEEVSKMEHPVVWIWYPWRLNPEPPTPSLPCPNALKNLHGAVYSDLTPVQKKRHAEMLYGVTIPVKRSAEHDAKHPFLARILSEWSGQPKGFPYWYKKYPTRRHAYETRFNIPKEMLEGYPPDVVRTVSADLMSDAEKVRAEKALYIERYAEHDLDTTSPAVTCVLLALKSRNLRNHLLVNPHNNIIKFALSSTERNLCRSLRKLRKIDFRKYWEIIRDHDVQDIIQPHNKVSYRWGAYWHYDWNIGLAISTNIPDFMDPRGLNGCVETGRSRAEVARDLGLSYTRSLTDQEKKQLSHKAQYMERLKKFKAENPEVFKEQQRAAFLRKFTGMFTKITRKSVAPDFPNRYRKLLGNKIIRWRSARHGPT